MDIHLLKPNIFVMTRNSDVFNKTQLKQFKADVNLEFFWRWCGSFNTKLLFLGAASIKIKRQGKKFISNIWHFDVNTNVLSEQTQLSQFTKSSSLNIYKSFIVASRSRVSSLARLSSSPPPPVLRLRQVYLAAFAFKYIPFFLLDLVFGS